VFKITTRRLVALLSAVALSAVLLLLLLARPDGPSVSWRNYCRIQPGMTRAEVEELLGGPAGGYCTEWTELELDLSLPPPPDDGEMWSADDGGIIVMFDRSGRVQAHGWVRSKYGTKWSIRRFVWRLDRWWRDVEE
jgi:hypothetical protein